MIPALGAVLFLMIAGVLASDLRAGADRLPCWARWSTFGVLLVGAICYSRYHETLLAGQDEGAYLHAACAYLAADSLFMKDELLALVPPEKRGLFMFGHGGFGDTRDNALSIYDLDDAKLRPRFQPALPMLLAGAMKLSGSVRGAYAVTPIGVLLTALALGLLAARLSRAPVAMPVGAALFLLNPLVAWHGRMPRPEFFAAFLCASAALMLLQARRGGRGLWLLVSGAVAAGMAPFFHVTALLFMVVYFVLATWVARRTLSVIAALHAVGLITGGLFAAQVLYVTHHYLALSQMMQAALLTPWRWGVLAMIVAAEGAVAGLWIVSSRWRFARWHGRRVRLASILLGLLMIVVWVVFFIMAPPLEQRTFEGYLFSYAAPTDMRSVVAYLRPLPCALVLVGLLRLLWLRRRRDAVLLLLLLFPSTLALGVIYDLFITRYLLITMVPLMIIGLCGWLSAVSVRKRLFPWAPVAGLVTLCAAWVWMYTPLYTVRDYSGMNRTLRKVASPVVASGGLLLCEYPRLAVPMERVYSIPTLALSRQIYRRSYDEHLVAWRKVCDNFPQRPVFFMTPFDKPEWSGIELELVEESAMRHYKPRGGLFNPPSRRVREANKHIRLYRMRWSAAD